MAKKIARPAESWTYVLAEDRKLPVEEQSRFVLRPLTQSERAAVQDALARLETEEDGRQIILGRNRQQGLEIALTNIVSIENFPAGAPEPWPNDRALRRQYLENLRDDFVQELADEVWRKSSIENDVKNS